VFPLLNSTISEINQNTDLACGSGYPVVVVSADSPFSDLFIPLAGWLLRRCNYRQRLSYLCAVCDVQTVMAIEGNRRLECDLLQSPRYLLTCRIAYVLHVLNTREELNLKMEALHVSKASVNFR
jgi:hypothetical protein